MSIKHFITDYWAARSESFAKAKQEELDSDLGTRWSEELQKHLKNGQNLNVLDVGCGPGFFSHLLADMGHRVTGIDLTQEMIDQANDNVGQHYANTHFQTMDAENLIFEDDSFDIVVTRNLTWTLPDPERAYQEWFRVLKQRGRLINVDADYGRVDHVALERSGQEDVHAIDESFLSRNDAIKKQLTISRETRPVWDLDVLVATGFVDVTCDMEINQKIYQMEDLYYNQVPPFLLTGMKPERF